MFALMTHQFLLVLVAACAVIAFCSTMYAFISKDRDSLYWLWMIPACAIVGALIYMWSDHELKNHLERKERKEWFIETYDPLTIEAFHVSVEQGDEYIHQTTWTDNQKRSCTGVIKKGAADPPWVLFDKRCGEIGEDAPLEGEE